MPSITVRDEISGQPRIIENPLLAEHVKTGCLLWYDGTTSIGRWDCPAVITTVDKKKRRFRVRSLDDMREQNQWYEFSISEHSPGSREVMRLSNEAEVKQYLDRRQRVIELGIADHRKSLASAEDSLTHFKEIRENLKL